MTCPRQLYLISWGGVVIAAQGLAPRLGAMIDHYKMESGWGTWLVRSVEHVTLDPGVVSSSPALGIEFTFK